jgi:hypothetical protein
MDAQSETEFASFLRTLGESKPEPEPERGAKRQRFGGDRATPVEAGSGENKAEAGGGTGASTTRRVLSEIASLSGEPDRYRMLEKKLWENVDNLVPSVMSFSDWSKGLRELREANQAAERASGQSVDDPLGAIRQFLAGDN